MTQEIALAGERGDQYTNKATLHNNDQVVIFDSEDLDSNGRPKTKTILGSLINSGGGGGLIVDKEFILYAGAWDLQSAAPALYFRDAETNVDMYYHAFPDTGIVYGERIITLPHNVNPAGTVTFDLFGYAATGPTAAKNIELKVSNNSIINGVDWNTSLATKEIDSGDLAIDIEPGPPSPAYLNRNTFTETIANLGWVSNAQVKLQWSRIAPSINNLVGDYRVTAFKLRVPRA